MKTKTTFVALLIGLWGCVSVFAQEPRPADSNAQISVNVLGAVKAPGRYAMINTFNALDLLAMIGGLAPDADLVHVRLVRQRNSAKPFVNEINLKDVLDGAVAAPTFEDGDTLVIPKQNIKIAY